MSHVICVELADGLNGDVQFMGEGQQRRRREQGGRGPGLGFGGADALLGLGEMSLDGFGAVRAVFCSIDMGESGPAGIVAGFDSSKPGHFDNRFNNTHWFDDCLDLSHDVASSPCFRRRLIDVVDCDCDKNLVRQDGAGN